MTANAERVIRVGSVGKTILQLLALCERAPTGILVRLLGGRRFGSTRQILARLLKTGLIRAEYAKPSLMIASRHVRLWSLTPAGSAFVSARAEIALPSRMNEFPLIRPKRIAARQSTGRLIVAYSALCSFLATLQSHFCLCAWEAQFVRSFSSPDERGTWHVRIEAGAGLNVGNDGTKITALLLVDPGTIWVVSFRSLLLRLYALRGTFRSRLEPDQLLLVIAMPDGEASERRRETWRKLLQQVARQLDERPIRTQFVAWNQRSQLARSADSNVQKRRLAMRPSQMDSVLLVLARHPLLTRKQLACLLCTSPGRILRVQRQLIDCGLLQPLRTSNHRGSFIKQLGLTQLTSGGQREATARLPLFRQSSVRNGFVERRPGVHRRLLCNLEHTVGVNDIFVSLVEVAREITRKGGDDVLEEWRSAAACARGSFRPDGYGCYRRGKARYGFFVEYDRGTERRLEYASKLATYYRYRDRGSARFEFEGFPTLLFITTRSIAEERFAREATRIAARTPGAPLNVLLTTTLLTSAHPQGILGDIWSRPEGLLASGPARRQHWLPPEALSGTVNGARWRASLVRPDGDIRPAADGAS